MRRLVAAGVVLVLTTVSLAAEGTGEDLLRDLHAACDDEARAGIVAALGETRAEPVREALEALAADRDASPALRIEAICALGGSATQDSVPLLLEILETDLDERHGFWACAIPLLGALEDRRALPLLERIADLGEEHLAGMDHMAIEAVAAMADARELGFLERKAMIWPVRPAVFEALARIAAPTSAPLLATGLLTGEDTRTLAAAETGLLAIGAPARAVLEEMVKVEPDPEFIRRAADLLGRLP